MSNKGLPFPDLPARMSEDEFWEVFGRRESGQVEFKERTEKAGKLQATLAAFANGQGGVVVFGVAHPPPYRVVGCEASQGLEEQIQAAARETRPPVMVEVAPMFVGGTPVVICQVRSLERGWVQTSGGATVVRAGPLNRTLFGEELERFVRERSGISVEDEPAREFGFSDLRGDLVKTYVRARVKQSQPSTREALLRLGYTEPDGTPRLAGVLCFGEDPQRVHRRFGIEVQRLEGSVDAPGELRETVALAGPLPEVIVDADRHIYDTMRRDAVVRGLIREEVPEYPPKVVREALVNAVAHRDYSATGASITVRLFDDALEIESPGCLPGYVTLDNLREVQYSRNPRVMDVLNHLGLVEEAGQGIDRMIREMEAALLDPPQFDERANSFVVRLRGSGVFSAEDRLWVGRFSHLALSGNERAALVYARKQGFIRNAELRSLRHLDREQARTLLQDLCASGLLQPVGRGRGTHYVLGPATADASGEMTLNDQLEAILAHATRQGSLVNADVRGLLEVDRLTALRLLRELVQRGYLRAVGQRRGRRYYPADGGPGS